MILWAAARGGWPLHPDFVGGLLPGPALIGSADLCDLGMVVWGVARLQAGAPSRGLLGAVLVVSARELMRALEAAAGGDAQSDGKIGGAQGNPQQQQQQQQQERRGGSGVVSAVVALGSVRARGDGGGGGGASKVGGGLPSPQASAGQLNPPEASSVLPQSAAVPHG
eukprot:scaffold113415_cov22-Tisochrysis_lutea.AAC.1